MEDNENDTDDVEMVEDNEEDISLPCNKCDLYISYKVYDFHIIWCKGKKIEKDKCPICKKLISKQIYTKHLQTCHETNKIQTALNTKDMGEFCPVCKQLISSKMYRIHLSKCYRKKDKRDEERELNSIKQSRKKKKCLICNKLFTKNDFLSHVSICNIENDINDINDDIIDNQNQIKKNKPIFSGLISTKMPSSKNISKGNIKGKFIRNRSVKKEKHLWRQAFTNGHLKYIPPTIKNKRKYESSSDSDMTPQRKKRKLSSNHNGIKDKNESIEIYKQNIAVLEQRNNEFEKRMDIMKKRLNLLECKPETINAMSLNELSKLKIETQKRMRLIEEAERQLMENTFKCVVCMDNLKNISFDGGCNHIALCDKCESILEYKLCPICQTPYNNAKKVKF